jgi:hypothetical protein
MEYLYLAAVAAGAFALGWLTARTIYGEPRKRLVQDDPIAHDDFTRSVMDWGRRYER